MVLFVHLPQGAISMSSNTVRIFFFFSAITSAALFLNKHEHNELWKWCEGHGADGEIRLVSTAPGVQTACSGATRWLAASAQTTQDWRRNLVFNLGLQQFVFTEIIFFVHLVVIRIQVLHQIWKTPTTNIRFKKVEAMCVVGHELFFQHVM